MAQCGSQAGPRLDGTGTTFLTVPSSTQTAALGQVCKMLGTSGSLCPSSGTRWSCMPVRCRVAQTLVGMGLRGRREGDQGRAAPALGLGAAFGRTGAMAWVRGADLLHPSAYQLLGSWCILHMGWLDQRTSACSVSLWLLCPSWLHPVPCWSSSQGVVMKEPVNGADWVQCPAGGGRGQSDAQ